MLKWIQSGLLGFLIGLSTSYIILTIDLIAEGNSSITGQELLTQVIIASVMGIIIGFLSRIFALENISLLLATIIHFLGVTLIVIVAGYFGSWFTLSHLESLGGVIISEIIAYIIIWGVTYILIKDELKQLNRLIQERRESHD